MAEQDTGQTVELLQTLIRNVCVEMDARRRRAGEAVRNADAAAGVPGADRHRPSAAPAHARSDVARGPD